jgi:type II secretion system protein N
MNEEVLETPNEAVPASKLKKTITSIGLGILFIFFLVLFTFTKLPQTKITSLLQGYVQVGLDPYGIYMSDHGRELSVWKGFEYRLTQPTLELADQTRVELDEVVVKPSLLGFFSGRAGGHVEVKQGASSIDLNGSGRGDKIDTTINLTDVDIGKFGLLSFAGGLKGSGTVSGSIHIDGTLSDLPTLTGSIQLKLKRLKLDEQNLMGFQLPTMNVSDGTIDISIDHGKLVMKNVQIGKGTDDLQVAVTGDVTLNRFLNASALNLRAVLGLSDKVKQSISLIDSILGPAKQADGRYAYKLTGTLGAPFPLPDTAH